jgi:nicotinamide-nucleotide adenylyltransferase
MRGPHVADGFNQDLGDSLGLDSRMMEYGNTMIHWPHDLTSLLSLYRTYDAVDPKGPPAVSMVLRADSPAKRVGILPSSFNPPTAAHLGLAESAKTNLSLDEVVLSLGKVIVDKKISGLTPADRLLVLCALSRHRKDLSIAVPSCGLYVDMAQAFRAEYGQGAELFFIVGFDKIEQILDPKYYQDRDASLEKLFSMAKIAVAGRGDQDNDDLGVLLQKSENQKFSPFISHLPLDPKLSAISSTKIRELAKGKNLFTKDIPRDVAVFIRETFAYQAPHTFLQEQLDLYQLRSDLVARAAQSMIAGGDLAPLWTNLCERSERGASRRALLQSGAPWETLVDALS